ncbi:unnamed protein product, partial [marine sediment metagenome]
IEGGRWPVFVSYRVPASKYWYLPRVDNAADFATQASVWWQRAALLHEHGLTLEAWRDALQACRLNSEYYSRSDRLLGNEGGRKGRLAILIRGRLWNEACAELEYWAKKSELTPHELLWRRFLEAHGLEMRVYSTYTASDPDSYLARFRQYFPAIHLGYSLAPRPFLPHLAARAEGRLYIPQDGLYRFGILTTLDSPLAIEIDGKRVHEFSRYRTDDGSNPPGIFLTRGMHAFLAENCILLRYDGVPPVRPCISDPLSYLYGFDVFWSLKWQYEDGEMTLIPPEYLYVSGAEMVARPPL